MSVSRTESLLLPLCARLSRRSVLSLPERLEGRSKHVFPGLGHHFQEKPRASMGRRHTRGRGRRQGRPAWKRHQQGTLNSPARCGLCSTQAPGRNRRLCVVCSRWTSAAQASGRRPQPGSCKLELSIRPSHALHCGATHPLEIPEPNLARTRCERRGLIRLPMPDGKR